MDVGPMLLLGAFSAALLVLVVDEVRRWRRIRRALKRARRRGGYIYDQERD